MHTVNIISDGSSDVSLSGRLDVSAVKFYLVKLKGATRKLLALFTRRLLWVATCRLNVTTLSLRSAMPAYPFMQMVDVVTEPPSPIMPM